MWRDFRILSDCRPDKNQQPIGAVLLVTSSLSRHTFTLHGICMDPKLMSVLNQHSYAAIITPSFTRSSRAAIVHESSNSSQWCRQWTLWCVRSSDNLLPTSFLTNMWPCQCSWTSMSQHQTTCSACLQTQNCQREHGRESCIMQGRHSDICWTRAPLTKTLTKAWLQSQQLSQSVQADLIGLIQDWY